MANYFPKGRDSKLTPPLQRQIIRSLEAGNYRAVACGRVGISHGTFKNWLTKGKRGKEPYAQFRLAVITAEYIAESKIVSRITEASKDDWRAGKSWLEAKHPERWASSKRIELSGEVTLKEIKLAFSAAIEGDNDVASGNWKAASEWADSVLGDDSDDDEDFEDDDDEDFEDAE